MNNKTHRSSLCFAKTDETGNKSGLNHQSNQNHIGNLYNNVDVAELKAKKFSNVVSFNKFLQTVENKSIRNANSAANSDMPKQLVTTVMFTDVVKSTQLAFEMGDIQWLELLQSHHNLIRRNLEKYSGRELQIIGDSFFVCFSSTVQAIECAQNIQSDMKSVNLLIRIGIHTGEVLLLNESRISGVTIHIASKVTAIACANQIVVSQTVKDIVTGSKNVFKNLGFHTLQGLPDPWNLYSLVNNKQQYTSG